MDVLVLVLARGEIENGTGREPSVHWCVCTPQSYPVGPKRLPSYACVWNTVDSLFGTDCSRGLGLPDAVVDGVGDDVFRMLGYEYGGVEKHAVV